MTITPNALKDVPVKKKVLDLDKMGWTLTTADLMDLFDASNMTIYKWRTFKGLPFCEIPTASNKKCLIRFNEKEVKNWADERGIELASA